MQLIPSIANGNRYVKLRLSELERTILVQRTRRRRATTLIGWRSEFPKMVDIYNAAKRSEIMSQIRSRGTKPEKTLQEIVRSILGPRRHIEKNVNELPGRPDVIVPSLRLIIFVDGCFYHSCFKHGRVPKSNIDYWQPKLHLNVVRAERSRSKLRRMGYLVWTVWEHDLVPSKRARTLARLERKFSKITSNARRREKTRGT
jgi:DNA mismatch endonuclease, patch repair protein